ncbi:MAG: DUF4194 domain-containing protein [Chromatiales bacterium]|nr:DUF4194 domain-containing protein [Chromatiales bacterium]
MNGIFDQLTRSGGTSIATVDDPHSALQEESPQEAAAATTLRQVKDVAQELLKHGLLEQARKPNLYRAALQHHAELNRLLDPFDLALRIDEVRGLAFLVVGEGLRDADVADEWSHPLLRRQRLNLEQSLLVAILRQCFVAHEQEAGVGVGEARVAVEDLVVQLQLYLGELGSDAQERKRILGLLEQLKGHGLVSEVDAHEMLTVRPIIAHVANPENLQRLLEALRAEANAPDEGLA